jgi:hypothetical protein
VCRQKQGRSQYDSKHRVYFAPPMKASVPIFGGWDSLSRTLASSSMQAGARALPAF